jgi:aerobic carbon-monoxide dehydrogenase large subunit
MAAELAHTLKVWQVTNSEVINVRLQDVTPKLAKLASEASFQPNSGTMINPMVVDGQIQGGVAQGIGTALYEQLLYDENGQLLTGTLMDYLAPTAADVPRVEIAHIESPSPYTPKGIKGMGEGGALAPPAALTNAVADALAPFGARINEIPLTPERVLNCIARGQNES